MAQENFNVSEPNDGLGDKLRAAFIKVQSNFTDLFTDKVDKEAGKGLSTNDYTTTEKTKLGNIADFAEVNVQADFLQNDDTQDDFIKNKPTIPVLGDYLLNGGYIGTAQDIEDSITLQQATAGANKNLVDGIFQAGTFTGLGQSGINVNQIGAGAGTNNTGNEQNAFGEGAGVNNTNRHQNAFGAGAGTNNTGVSQNAFGAGAGVNNTFNDVNLFGENTQADENGQTVFRSAGGFMVRLSTLLLTATRKYVFPNKSGTFAMLSDLPIKSVLANVTLTPANWTLVSGNRQATITDALIFLGSTPIVTPTIATANIADLAEIFEDIIVSNGSFILTARYLPTANIVIKTTLL